ncbi:lipocalin-like domain-containing protein [Telluribacter sp. SYSU D00476]|uniref:lipocalin-like domain-containing protein n=1 Tax=Telluribacter sp. SYSU D00476 TaxID=2811430 RepID=UPI001FF40FA9|nr:lipocalin-like domain-containing protein [Telluribacter sp. SYSU D00476]
MKRTPTYTVFLFASLLFSCNSKTDQLPLEGTWELISATATEKDSTYSTFDSSRSMIKILNKSHFAFLNHAINARTDSTAASTVAPYSAGGGTYTLVDSTYTEHLNYYSDPAWENHSFEFVVKIQKDTLIQKGVEKIEELGIDRIIIEKYKRVKAEPKPQS